MIIAHQTTICFEPLQKLWEILVKQVLAQLINNWPFQCGTSIMVNRFCAFPILKAFYCMTD